MCYHYSLTKPQLDLEERFDATLEYEWITQYHVGGFDNAKMPVITSEQPGIIQPFEWGLIPSWVTSRDQKNEIRTKGSTLNAKSETVFELPSFKGSIVRMRCLVLADGFFEWRHDANDKIPHYITLKNQQAFAMAGIYDHWTDRQTGEQVKSFSVLTCEANPLMKKIHNIKMRMPVILPKQLEKNWLNKELPPSEIQTMFLAYPEESMQAWTISKLITSKSGNSNVPAVLDKFDYAIQQGLF